MSSEFITGVKGNDEIHGCISKPGEDTILASIFLIAEIFSHASNSKSFYRYFPGLSEITILSLL